MCIDDANFLDKPESSFPYELDCVYNGISAINLVEANLHFAYKIDVGFWVNSDFPRFDCNEEMFGWSGYRVNLTYTMQQECDTTLAKSAGIRRGARCVIRKYFLENEFFKINRFVLETRSDVYPIPYGVNIIYTCN
jgi:hypothetical protein